MTAENPQGLESSPSAEISYVVPNSNPTPTPTPPTSPTPTPTPTPTSSPTPTPTQTPTPTPSSTPTPTPTSADDLKITVTDGTPTATPGAKNIYTVVVTNAGASVVTGAAITDVFPTSFTNVTYTAWQSGGALGFTDSGTGNITDTVTMWPGSTITYKAKGILCSSATGTFSNIATVAAPSGTTDSNLANNNAIDSDALKAQPDLNIRLEDGNTATSPGADNTYNIVVTNFGPSDISGCIVKDSFPSIFNGVTFTATQSGGASGFSSSGSGNINNVVTIPAGSKISYKAHGTISTSASGSISNTATVTAPNGAIDPDLSNNSAIDSDTLNAQADLNIRVDDGNTTTSPGAKGTYNIVVTNFGPSDVSGAVVKDSFPGIFNGVTFTTTQSGGASGFISSGSGNINNVVTMPPGSKISYKAHGTISTSASGSLSNTATVTAPSGVSDSKLSNNSATDTDTLQ